MSMTYREAEQASMKRGVGVRRQTWPDGMYHRYHRDGSLTAGYVGGDEVEIHDEHGSHSLERNTLDLTLDRDDMVAYLLGKADWEVVKED